MKKLLLLILSVLFAGILTACDPAPKHNQGKPVIALMTLPESEEVTARMTLGARNHWKDQVEAYKIKVVSMRGTEPSEQVQLVENLIGQGVSAIVIDPADPVALVPVLKRAAKKKIKIVNIRTHLDPAAVKKHKLKALFVGPDEQKAAKAVGIYLASFLKEGNTVGMITGANEERRLGFEAAMKEAGLVIKTTANGENDQSKAKAVTTEMLKTFQSMHGLICTDDAMGIGAHEAMQEADFKGLMKVVGYGNRTGVQDLMAEGDYLATADPQPGKIAAAGMELALAILNGSPAADQETPVELITQPKTPE